MFRKIRDWLARRRAERISREEQQVEDFVRAEDEARGHNGAPELLEHDHPIDLRRQPPL
jgi:hypothetical protein